MRRIYIINDCVSEKIERSKDAGLIVCVPFWSAQPSLQRNITSKEANIEKKIMDHFAFTLTPF